MPYEIILAAGIGMNIIAFLLMMIDKQKARKRKWRIKESTLWLFTILGGAIGSFLGMILFRHKTKHTSFTIGFPLLAIIQFFFYYYITNLL